MKEYFLKLVPKISMWILIIWAILMLAYKCSEEERPKAKDYFKYDSNQNAWDVADYDYETGEIRYRDYTPTKIEPGYTSPSSIEDIILDANLEVEDLIDNQLD